MSMSSKKSLYQVPVASTSFTTEAYYEGRHPWALRYGYHKDAMIYRSGIRFKKLKATRHYVESCCTVWHIEAYDTLVEVEDSPWVEEIQASTAERQRRLNQKWELHHYMIYLDSVGSYEFIAESWEVLPEEAGSWPKI